MMRERSVPVRGPTRTAGWKRNAILLVPRADQLLLPAEARQFAGQTANYEELGREALWKLRPQTAILLPYKRPPRQSGNDPIARRAAYALRKWFCAGCHLIAIVPRRRSDGASFRDRELVWGMLNLLKAAVPAFSVELVPPPVDAGATHIVRSCGVVKLRSLDMDFYVSLRDRKGFKVPAQADDFGEPFPAALQSPAKFEILAENAIPTPVVVSLRQGRGRITLVPRGMLSGLLEWLNDAIPRVQFLHFPNDYRVLAGIAELSSGPAEQRAGNRFAGDSRKSWIVVNGRAYKVPWRGSLLLRVLHNRVVKRWDAPHLAPDDRWPSALADRKTRENVARGLRERLGQLDLELLTRGSPSEPPTLTPSALAGVAGLDHGWERWDTKDDWVDEDGPHLMIRRTDEGET